MFLHVPPFFDGPDMPLLPSWQLPCHFGFVSPQEAHNDFRREHGSCALQWSDECYQAAKRQANACQAKRCMFHATWHVRNIQEMPKLERSRLPFYLFFGVCVCGPSQKMWNLYLSFFQQGDRALWCYSVQRSYASKTETSIGHGCAPADHEHGDWNNGVVLLPFFSCWKAVVASSSLEWEHIMHWDTLGASVLLESMWTISKDIKLVFSWAGGSWFAYPVQRSYGKSVDGWSDQRDCLVSFFSLAVGASFKEFKIMSRRHWCLKVQSMSVCQLREQLPRHSVLQVHFKYEMHATQFDICSWNIF